MSVKCWSKRSRARPLPGESCPPQGKGIHVLLFWTKAGERYLSHTGGEVTAEELCISAAQDIGVSPVCHVLFALYDPLERCWYTPNHVFSPEENSSLVLQYRMRFYFHNWHGHVKKQPTVSRYCARSRTDQEGSPLLDISSLEYLFAQAKYEFVNDIVKMEDAESEEELSHFKNGCLGMAVLQLSHQALQADCSLQEAADKVSFLRCIPKSFSRSISQGNFLTKIRIRRVFANSVRSFQQHTVDKGRLSTQKIMHLYVFTLEHLVPHFGTETFAVSHLEVRSDGDSSSSHFNKVNAHDADKDDHEAPATHEIKVSGTEGIEWRKMSEQKVPANTRSRNDYLNSAKKPKSQLIQPNQKTRNDWTSFCDFPEITHVAISGANLSISTQDNRCMVVQMRSGQEARSFVSLLDGYYRLTADAHHYLCHEVAPPRVVLSEANGLHGPLQEEFVLMKLKKEAAEEGAFLVRWSALDFNTIILSVLKNENGTTPKLKQFRIRKKGSVFGLTGWEPEFSSVKELMDSLRTLVLQSGPDSFGVRKCCFPRPAELSNLLVMRKGSNHQVSAEPRPGVSFNTIKERDIVQEQHLGRGTRTNIFLGRLYKQREQPGNNNLSEESIRVVLKALDQSHKDHALDIASLMSQVSHSHLVFMHGVCVKGNIMVEEYVEFGPLDVFLRKEKASIAPQWKLIVAKQLATALSYLETKKLVHGNVCAKNILVARRGLEPGTTPFIKLSDPGISLNVLSRNERLERIPWIAPECVDGDGSASLTADQWSFGVTLLEIYNNGELPMSRCSLAKKEHFYQQRGHLPEPSSQELATFIRTCLTYEPAERPSFLVVLRELPKLPELNNPDLTPTDNEPDSNVYHKRYLKEIRVLGEGHFGKVTLYLYDPAGDGTGEYVAAKALKQDVLLTSCKPDNGHESWMKEIKTLKSLDHSNIVKYKGCCSELGGQVVQLIMEYLPQGSLRDYLPRRKLGMVQCLMFAQQICEGMVYLHSKRYIHRDLAARNVLVENNSLVKIGDFGLTKYIPEGAIYYRMSEGGDSPVYWYAIECLKDGKYSFSSDVWSFAVTVYEILTHCDTKQSPPVKFAEMSGKPLREMSTVVLTNLLERNQRLPCPADAPLEVKMLMQQCWATDPAQRPSFESLVEQLEIIRGSYNPQPGATFSLAQIC